MTKPMLYFSRDWLMQWPGVQKALKEDITSFYQKYPYHAECTEIEIEAMSSIANRGKVLSIELDNGDFILKNE
ncbi:MAG: hypothetical protein DRI97_03945 [Bacteroidetes bacterium]|nr:MAG: hypothetical protein DRQ42_00460 [Gammaproteobacteria bacterium]RLD58107.1 MAG: hypothetical protein DRI97_03945 [Bacteroidota bacterium]